MQIEFIKRDTLDNLKSNLESYCTYFAENDNKYLFEAWGCDLLTKSRVTMPDRIIMYMPENYDVVKTDFKNVKIFYEAFRHLTDVQASDERIWAGLCVGQFWDYVQYRWGSKAEVDFIKQHYFYGASARRSLTRNALARLWWIGRLTYDDQNPTDKYAITKFICEASRYVTDLLERNFSNNIHILSSLVQAIIDARSNGYKITTDDVRDIAKYIEVMGGVYILDCLTREKIYQLTMAKIIDIKKQI